MTSGIPPLALWLLAIPALFAASSIFLLIRYKGWASFDLRGTAQWRSPVSPWVEREFILGQYRKFQEHTEKINQIIRLRGHVDAKERRHDTVLRDLIQTRQYKNARSYLEAMISVCKEFGDLDGEITYITYRDTFGHMAGDESHNGGHDNGNA